MGQTIHRGGYATDVQRAVGVWLPPPTIHQLYTDGPCPVPLKGDVHVHPPGRSEPRIFWYKWAVPKYFGRMGRWGRRNALNSTVHGLCTISRTLKCVYARVFACARGGFLFCLSGCHGLSLVFHTFGPKKITGHP